jgi:pyruvate dehydrogenase E2 component (dihydrolipoamide acetyltransferase)
MARMRAERLDYAGRWLLDGLRVLRPPVSLLQVSVDMTNALERLEALRRSGVQASTTHQLAHAAAAAFAANPSLHQFLAGSRRHWPARVDIGLSVAGETFVAPVLVIEGADRKSVGEIASEVARRVPEVREADARFLRALRLWGWVVPFGFVRRALLRLFFRSPGFRSRGAGTFQVSTVSGDWGATSTFATAGVLVAGQVWPRVVARDGQPAVRPLMTLTLSGDHGVWDGRAAARFLAAVQGELER